jgi:ParB/RepB/Spo0J family partition protein
MTSGVFRMISVEAIQVPEDRQRKEFKPEDIESLAGSIKRRGLIHPLLITEEGLQLISGERRLLAIKSLGWDTVACQFQTEISERELHALELEENTKRTDLTWQETCAAILKYHEDRLIEVNNWVEEDTAAALGFERSWLNRQIAVAKELRRGNTVVAEAPKLSTAVGLVTRAAERKKQAEVAGLLGKMYDRPGDTLSSVEAYLPIQNLDFLQWLETYEGPKFNFIHCDFPYGINADQMQQGYSVGEHGGYTDTPETYFRLLDQFVEHHDKFVAESAHLIFWFSMRYYTETIQFLRRSRFIIDDFPLIWQKDVGLLPDPQRGPRRVYETALFGRAGDRKIVRAVSNAITLPRGSDHIHMSAKPAPVLEHFFRMLVDGSTSLFDPTAGGGTALQAAAALGAFAVAGLEINADFCGRANAVLQRQKMELLLKETQ